MTLSSVRAFLAEHAPDLDILETEKSTATVAEAAEVHGVERAQIAKTLSLWLRDEVILLMLGGDARVDNRKYKQQFGEKARMLNPEEVEEWTGHPVGGVCPFGLRRQLKIFSDVSLRRFEFVLPAAGATNTAVRVTPERLGVLVDAQWVDVAQAPSLLMVP